VSRSLIASLHWLPIHQRVTFKLAGLVYCSLHETSPTNFSFTLILQHDHFDLLLPTYWLNSVSELHLLLVASDLPSAGPRNWDSLQMTSNLLPLSLRSNTDSKLTSLLPLVNNWQLSELSAPLNRRHTQFCECYKHYITLNTCLVHCIIILFKTNNDPICAIGSVSCFLIIRYYNVG